MRLSISRALAGLLLMLLGACESAAPTAVPTTAPAPTATLNSVPPPATIAQSPPTATPAAAPATASPAVAASPTPPQAGDGQIDQAALYHMSRDPLYRAPGGAVPAGTKVTLRL